jgi:hypothetical protein
MSLLKKLTTRTLTYLANFIELQLVITLMSLPILIAWGLPISSMTLISNLIFTPILIVFLWLSTLFACCVLLHLPCSWLSTCMSHLSDCWMWLLSFSKPSWLLGFGMPLWYPALLVCCSILLFYTWHKPNIKQSLLFLTLCCTCMLSARWYHMKNCYKKLSHLPMIALRMHNKNYLIDYGALCRKQNFYTQIDYTIIPELIKQTGMTTIDTLVLCKPSKRLAKITMQFAKQCNIKTILCTQKQQCFKTLKMCCKNSDLKILPLKHKKHLLT